MSVRATTGQERAELRRFGPNHRWTVLGIGVAAQASFSAAISGLPVTGTSMRADYLLTTATLGLVIGAIYLGIAVSEIAWGIWTDRFGERKVLLVGLLSTAAVLALMAIGVVPSAGATPPTWLLVAGMFLVGVLGGSINGSSGRAVMAWFQEGQRGLAMSIRQTAMPAGGAIGIALLPGLAAAYGFRVVYLILAGLCFLTAVATFIWLHEPGKTASAGGPAEIASARSPLARWDIWRLALASALLTMPQFGILTFSAVFLHDAKGAGVLTTVLTLIVVQVGGGAARILSGRYTDKRGNRRRVIKQFGGAAAVMLLLAAVLVDAPTVLVAAVLAIGGIFANAWHGVAYTEIASMAGHAKAGTALGLENTTVFSMGFITPLLIPLVLGWSGSWMLVWLLIGVASALAVPLAPAVLKAARTPAQAGGSA
ncbi:MFS transporter [Amycolatopsis sp., V23-08]|uniref:MFS transporter n=1 Tax=Amycolatopsis heterodermiae TaxID=3110235 RepID=A0ABU5R3A9_9PSEU|nr:MFS transporter [Amycolatopsis sp., V23-08]MEA5360335.1 MFS transporter [Amycolatopsis sp., V23-08]